MRADNDHVVGNSVESCKDESKPHQCPEEKWEDAELKIQENGKNGSNVPPELFYDTRTGDEWDKENDGKDSNEDGKNNIDAKSGSPEPVDPVFFMDKNVTACDLPEIVVCYNENTYYHVVKDICVDEGVPVQEKFLFGEKGSVKCSSDSNQCESEDLMKADKGIETIISSEEDRNGKVDDESELCNDPKTNQDVEESPREDFADAEGSSSSCNQDHLIVTREAKDSHEIEVATSENVPKESKTLGDILSWEDEPKPLEEQSQPQLQEKERDEPKEAEEEKLSSLPTTISQEPNKPFNDNQQPSLVVGDTLEDNKLISGGFGETSFSGAEAVSISGHITYTGPIAFSGSLSVRSDASTTSGRSFAFPVLQSEWNSSPVRMAKPEKRRHKGWRQILLCCRSS
ncbi:hypothetical protein BRARA_F03352 [Brassica rapa]|uniref:Uncharacterized protein n=1 Tax=Brassica campestris TaxID=3711 RepID=A0A397ZD30_BRACM|nr:uncharacterized protein LOC106389268 [Brassica napus]XP_022543650.1 uncharacterized protein LOC106389268 [Brassica napus]XP_048637188.1 uncharacterized protein LOC106389268 [Brassica napus]XP_048637189.1 uncharacterized protein LOC106389268 [Brassica napus]XP_048637190.1 uncharacterized protein LOC106389268 [Brassica napus]XP_048637191.1 uncharacterized protein LOC106389268 [Brassica napus]RID60173.1 hypothetical protein BRARA_F03352 [Brassica rapa]